MKDELPLGVGVEDAEGDISAEEREGEDAAEGFEDPCGIDELDHLRGRGALRVETGGVAGLGVRWHGSISFRT